MEHWPQLRFEWVVSNEADELNEVTLEPETVETVTRLMARALIAVVRAAEETDDER